MAAGAISGAIVGGVSAGVMSGGDPNAIMHGAFTGGISGGLFAGASQLGGADSFERYVGHAGAGCVSAMAGGGKCGSGAMAAFAGKWMTNKTVDLENRFAQFTAATISSGTVSVIGGGKFSNGAVTGAMGYLYNCELTKCWDKYLYYGSKTVLGIAGALGSASAGPMGAPALAFSLSTVYEGASGVANTVNDAPNKGGENPMVDAVKSVAARGGMSPAAQSLVANGVQVAADVAALRAPVRFVERWVFLQVLQ